MEGQKLAKGPAVPGPAGEPGPGVWVPLAPAAPVLVELVIVGQVKGLQALPEALQSLLVPEWLAGKFFWQMEWPERQVLL